MSPTDLRRHVTLLCAAALSAGVLSLGAFAQPQEQPKSGGRPPSQSEAAKVPAQDQDLPTAQEVLKKYIEATGGEETYKSVKTQHTVGKFSIPAMGAEGTFRQYSEQPDKFLVVIELPGMGEIRTGLNGKTGWHTDAMQGPRLLEGDELQTVIRDADMRSALKPEEYFEDMQVNGIEEVNGQKAYHLVMKPKSSKHPIESWYSVESGLQLKTAMTQSRRWARCASRRLWTTIASWRAMPR